MAEFTRLLNPSSPAFSGFRSRHRTQVGFEMTNHMFLMAPLLCCLSILILILLLFRTLLLLHPEMKPLLTPHPTSFTTSTSTNTTSSSLCLPLVPQLTDLGLHLACLQVASSLFHHRCCCCHRLHQHHHHQHDQHHHHQHHQDDNLPHLFKLVPKEGQNQRKLSPWLKKDFKVIQDFGKTIRCSIMLP